MTSTDDSLLRLCQAGNRGAFESLVHRTARLIYAHALPRVRDVHRTEDVVQEVYLHAWKSIGSLNDAGKLRSWLLTITDRVIVDFARRENRKKRAGVMEPSESLEHQPANTPAPEAQLTWTEQHQRAAAAMEKLPEEYRQVLQLRYLGGADLDQIAAQLAMSNGSLRGLLQRGMKMLRESLSQ